MEDLAWRNGRTGHDVWLGECPLMIRFPKLYKICRDKEVSVEEIGEVNWNLDFRRRLGNDEIAELFDLQEELELVQLTGERDQIKWALEKSGKYTTKSMYRLMKHSGEIDLRMMEVWEAKLPLSQNLYVDALARQGAHRRAA